MKVTVEALNPALLITRQGKNTQELRSALESIREDETKHRRLLKLATFSLPEEDKAAHSYRQSLMDYYGPDASIDGFTFSVATAADNTEQYVAVAYDPNKIEEGAWEAWKDDKAARHQAANARRMAVDGYVAGIVTIEDLTKTWQASGGNLDKMTQAVERGKERARKIAG
jgi:hypothetical protein